LFKCQPCQIFVIFGFGALATLGNLRFQNWLTLMASVLPLASSFSIARNRLHRNVWEKVLEGNLRKIVGILIFAQLILCVLLAG